MRICHTCYCAYMDIYAYLYSFVCVCIYVHVYKQVNVLFIGAHEYSPCSVYVDRDTHMHVYAQMLMYTQHICVHNLCMHITQIHGAECDAFASGVRL